MSATTTRCRPVLTVVCSTLNTVSCFFGLKLVVSVGSAFVAERAWLCTYAERSHILGEGRTCLEKEGLGVNE